LSTSVDILKTISDAQVQAAAFLRRLAAHRYNWCRF